MNPQFNEWNLPHGTEPHNPDGLTPEQITEGGKYRAVTLGELDGRHKFVAFGYEYTSKTWNVTFGHGNHITCRVPITTLLPAVKESLTPQPATGQSKTPRTDERADSAHMFDACTTVVLADFARTLETELAAALAERDEARRLLGEASRVLEDMRDFAAGAPDMPMSSLKKADSMLDQITNHLNK